MSDTHQKFAVGFNLVDGIGGAKIRSLKDYFGSLAAAWSATPQQLKALGFDQRTMANFFARRDQLDLDREMARVDSAGAQPITWDMTNYPRLLKTIAFPPPLLYVLGAIQPSDHRGIAIVGTRRMTNYGRQIAADLTRDLIGQGLTIVSGLARGIDTVVHETALRYGGRTIAVLGSGVDQIYPPENRSIVQQIVSDHQGAVMSEYPLGTRPQAKYFPPRNRIVSGMTWGTIIIEGDVKSGAMITAKLAVEQGREVFAVPGPIHSPSSKGPNWLIQQGAKLVTGIEDILEEVTLGTGYQVEMPHQLALPETAEEAALLPHLSLQPVHIDELIRLSALASPMVSSTLSIMEIKGMVVQHRPNYYALM